MNRFVNKHTLAGLLIGLVASVFASDVKDWDTSAANNNSAAPNGAPEGMAPSAVNDTIREVMAGVARLFTDINGSLASGGSSNAYTLTSGSVITSLDAGDFFRFEANHTNTGAATLNVDGTGAESIVMQDASALTAGDIQSGGVYTVVFDGSNFQLIDGGLPNSLFISGDTAAAATVDGIDAFSTSGAGASAIIGVFDGDSQQGYIRKRGDNGNLEFSNAEHGGGVFLRAENNSGTIITLLDGDPDGAVTISYAGSEKAASASTGLDITGSLDVTDASTTRTNLGLGSLATEDDINNGDWSGTDLAIANGGTGSSTASNARTALGVAIGSDVQAYDADLTALGGLAKTNSNFIVGNGSTWVAETGATARTSLGLGSLATASSINNGNWSGTDLAVTNGGTGSSSASGARTNLGIGSMAERDVTIQSGGSPSGGSNGDVVFIY